MGRSIYLTDKEIKAVRATCGELLEMMSDGDVQTPIEERLDNGLGSAMKKLYKGLNGERIYKDYKSR